MRFQILVQHIKTVLPGLKSRISSQLTAVSKELEIYGDPVDSKVCFKLIFFCSI
jgi:dynamin 1-like protein